MMTIHSLFHMATNENIFFSCEHINATQNWWEPSSVIWFHACMLPNKESEKTGALL